MPKNLFDVNVNSAKNRGYRSFLDRMEEGEASGNAVGQDGIFLLKIGGATYCEFLPNQVFDDKKSK